MAASDYIFKAELEHLLAALTVPNRLALEVSESTGLRIGDVLSLKTDSLKERMTVKEQKTGKSRRVRINPQLLRMLLAQSGRMYVFEGRTDWRKHRTRQAVYKDIRRAARLFRLDKSLNVSPHTARKVYAVEEYHKSGSLARVQSLLNHSNEGVTMIYALADVLTDRRLGRHD